MKNFILMIFSLGIWTIGLAQDECLTIYTDDDLERLPSWDVEIVDSKICVSTFYGGFYIIENDLVKSIDTFNVPLPDIVIRNMSKFADGLACSYRLGTTTTIYTYDFENEAFKEIISNEDIIPNDQTNMFNDNSPLCINSKNELLMVGTTSGLLTYDLDGDYQQFQDLDEDGVIDFIFDIDTRSEDEAWICTNSGLFTMDYLTLEFTKITDHTCSQLVVDQNDEVIFTDRLTDRLYQFMDTEVLEIAQSNGVITFKDVQDVVVDSDNKLVFISPNEVVVSEALSFEKLFDIEEGSSLATEDKLLVAGGKQIIVYNCPTSNSIGEIKEEASFRISHQIATDLIEISLSDVLSSSAVHLSILNANGLVVLKKVMTSSSQTISIDHLPSGIYHVVLNDGKYGSKKSFIKI